MNNIPLNIKLDNAKTKLVKALNECITEESYNKLVEQYRELIIEFCK